MEEPKVKMYFRSGSGILKPVDFDGNEIKEGDILTCDNFDPFFSDEYYKENRPAWTKEDIEKRKHTPTYKVHYNPEGFFYGEGINERLYLHDFRFKYCKIIK